LIPPKALAVRASRVPGLLRRPRSAEIGQIKAVFAKRWGSNRKDAAGRVDNLHPAETLCGGAAS
jgi:hypothetical protein